MCGSNNCRKKFGLYYHEKDDCCEKKENIVTTIRPKWVLIKSNNSGYFILVFLDFLWSLPRAKSVRGEIMVGGTAAL